MLYASRLRELLYEGSKKGSFKNKGVWSSGMILALGDGLVNQAEPSLWEALGSNPSSPLSFFLFPFFQGNDFVSFLEICREAFTCDQKKQVTL